MFLPVAPKIGAVGSIIIRFLVLNQPGQNLALGLPASQHVEDGCYVSEFNVELDEVGDVGLLLPAEYFGSVGLEVEEDRQPQRFLRVELEVFVLEEGHA